jgi:AbrB family looped-hinge helix DNA binding protein
MWDCLVNVGNVMNSPTVKLDEKGRVIIPKKIRKAAQLKEGTCVFVKAEGNKIIIEPVESVADKYFGIFKVSKWPDDLDEFTAEAIQKWWKSHGT